MPSAVLPEQPPNHITKLTNCRLVKGDELVNGDLWISSATGKILQSQKTFYDDNTLPDKTIDLGNRVISPGLIDAQFNGAYGFNFSSIPAHPSDYVKSVRDLSRRLIQTGVTSYVPTLTSQNSELYRAVLPLLGPSGRSRRAGDGAESLGAHVEGPFLNPTKHGIHNVDVLRSATAIDDLDEMYGASNFFPGTNDRVEIPVKMITVAPEQGNMLEIIPELRARGIICSIGHTEATYEEASAAVQAGATMITHLFNAMRSFSHRGPGVFGVLGTADDRLGRPYFGVIADGIHLHPTTIKIAFNAHPDGFMLVTDAMHLAGLPDGAYEWTNGDAVNKIVKKGSVLHLEDSDTIAGSSITLIDCVNNFLTYSGASVAKALKAVTATPAAMLGLQGVKGSLEPGADADLVILSERQVGGRTELIVDEVWKFGSPVFSSDRYIDLQD